MGCLSAVSADWTAIKMINKWKKDELHVKETSKVCLQQHKKNYAEIVTKQVAIKLILMKEISRFTTLQHYPKQNIGAIFDASHFPTENVLFARTQTFAKKYKRGHCTFDAKWCKQNFYPTSVVMSFLHPPELFQLSSPKKEAQWVSHNIHGWRERSAEMKIF